MQNLAKNTANKYKKFFVLCHPMKKNIIDIMASLATKKVIKEIHVETILIKNSVVIVAYSPRISWSSHPLISQRSQSRFPLLLLKAFSAD